ncbi:MAG: electron transfer flavoprotein subunit beta/FixA family protein [Spirochaetota bacterium]|nr:MAG: electron transfer flavoprotein subunit beta/FixA family protein [Spirochaetota bacterium]
MKEYTMVVLVKQVPDTQNLTGEAMKEDGTVNRSALPAIFNPEDLNALEMALQVREEYGGTVHVITMGPPSAVEVLKEAMYRGADRVYLLSDRKFAGSDTLATSFALKQAIQTKIPDFDIVFCGRQAIDGDTAQVGPQTAEKLDVPQLTYVESIQELGEKKIKVRKLIDNGTEIVETALPVLLTVTDTANEPRPFIAKKLLKYRKAACEFDLPKILPRYPQFKTKEELKNFLKKKGLFIEMWGLEDIKANKDDVGFAGSPTMVKKIESITLTGKGFKKIEPTDEGIAHFVAELIEDHTW